MKLKLFAALLFVLFLFNANAQVAVLSKNALNDIKNGNTHIIVSDVDFPRSAEFYRVFKKYWTVTKSIEFLKADELQNNLILGDSYFSLEGLVVTSNNAGGNMYVYLNLWMPTERGVKKKNFKIADENSLAHIQLSVDAEVFKKGYFNDKNYGFDFNGDGHIYNWNPGFIKNYLQQLTAALQTGKKSDFTDDITNKDQLPLLSDKVLYCPEGNLHKLGPFIAADKTVDPNEIFEDYKFKYQVISDREIDDKILADTEPFYYLLFLRNSSSKMVGVVNSGTGEIIYARYKTLMAFNLKSGDLKSLSKAISNK